jgi:integrase
MTKPAQRFPKYRHYKPKDLAVVRIDGRDIYLGKYNSAESREKYKRVIAEWLTTGTAPQPAASNVADPGGPTVNEVILAFLRHANDFYRRADGTPTGELENLRLALRPLKNLYGGTPARDFGPKALKAVRQDMINSGLCRRTINQRIGRIRRAFQFAVENELVPASVHHGLKAVKGLGRGRSEARESKSVKPVPDAHVDAVRPFVSRQIWAIIELQRLTGMRSGEVAIMRTCDLDTSGRLWIYTPERHKAEHHGKERRISIGPKAQAVLRPWLRADLMAYLFSPKEAMEEYQASRRQGRNTPLTPSQKARKRKAKPKKEPGSRYGPRAYAHAVARACERAGVPHWHPHQLRHNAGTFLRRECDMDTARAVLGHSDMATTAIYAERDAALADAAMERYG